MSQIYFKEVQKAKKWWIWLLVILFNGFILYMAIAQWFFGISLGNKPASNYELLLVVGIVLFFSVVLMNLQMTTWIKEDGIYVQFFPFHFKPRYYSWNDISKLYIREYKPLKEYGGWGIKGKKKNRAFNYSGKIGLQLELKNNHLVLIGTQKADEINSALSLLNKI